MPPEHPMVLCTWDYQSSNGNLHSITWTKLCSSARHRRTHWPGSQSLFVAKHRRNYAQAQAQEVKLPHPYNQLLKPSYLYNTFRACVGRNGCYESLKPQPISQNWGSSLVHETSSEDLYPDSRKSGLDWTSVLKETQSKTPLNRKTLQAMDIIMNALLSTPVPNFSYSGGHMKLDTEVCTLQTGCFLLHNSQVARQKLLSTGHVCSPKPSRDTIPCRENSCQMAGLSYSLDYITKVNVSLLKTDHKVFRCILNLANSKGRLARWWRNVSNLTSTCFPISKSRTKKLTRYCNFSPLEKTKAHLKTSNRSCP